MAVLFTKRAMPRGVNYVEYLRSDGRAYIDTGFKPNQNTKVVMEFASRHGSEGNFSSLFGAQQAWGQNSYTVGTYTAAFGAQTTTSLALSDGQKHSLEFDGRVRVDGNYVWAVSTPQSFQLPCTMYLFGNNENNTTLYPSKAEIYYCQIYDNGALIRDYWPCLDPDGVACLYDKVSREYVYNAGTGSFTAAGGDVPVTTWQKYSVKTQYTQKRSTVSSATLQGTGFLYMGTGYTFNAANGQFTVNGGRTAGIGESVNADVFQYAADNAYPSATGSKVYYSGGGANTSWWSSSGPDMSFLFCKYMNGYTIDFYCYSAEAATVKGDYIEDVTSSNEAAYPDNGIQDGYWYIKIS